MVDITPRYLSPTEFKSVFQKHLLRSHEIPSNCGVSFPLPTNRWSEPGYIVMCSPIAPPRGDIPPRQGAPESWGVFAAQGGRLLLFARTKVFPFTSDDILEVELTPLSKSIGEIQAGFARLEQILEMLTPLYFRNEHADSAFRTAFVKTFESVISPVLIPQYRKLAPDFFAWLET